MGLLMWCGGRDSNHSGRWFCWTIYLEVKSGAGDLMGRLTECKIALINSSYVEEGNHF